MVSGINGGMKTLKQHNKTGFYPLLVLCACLLSLLGSLCPVSSVHAGQTQAKYLVVIVIDGCRPDYLDIVPTPNIDSLISEGTYYTNAWVGQMNNDTPAGHTAISTGQFGKNNGVISFGWRDKRFMPPGIGMGSSLSRAVLKLVEATGWTGFGLWFQNKMMQKLIGQNSPCGWQNIISGVFTGLIEETGATSIGAEYKKAHPSAVVAAISCDKWFAAAALAADSADYTVFADAEGIPPFTYSPVTAIKPAGMLSAPPPDYIMNDASFIRDIDALYDTDTWTADVALSLIEKAQPEILLINLPATDDAGHKWGGINTPEKIGDVIANADRQIGRIIDAYRQTNKYDETLFVILADHGMTPAIETISQATLDRLYVQSGNFGTCTTHIYLLEQDESHNVAEQIIRAKIPGIHGAYYKVVTNDGTYSYEPVSTSQSIMQGDLDKAYRYLLSTWASEKSPDIELITAENWHIDFKTIRGKTFVGNHDSATWLQQHVPLLIAGPGVKKGTVSNSPARLVDIAPTVLTLLGITPENMDGIILADALQTPRAEHTQKQNELNAELLPLIKALKAQSNTDIAHLTSQ